MLTSVYWTWRLRAKLTDTSPRAPQETIRLLFAWALVGIIPTIIFFLAMYQSTVFMPSRFIERLNRSLSDFHVAYASDVSFLFINTVIMQLRWNFQCTNLINAFIYFWYVYI